MDGGKALRFPGSEPKEIFNIILSPCSATNKKYLMQLLQYYAKIPKIYTATEKYANTNIFHFIV